jgi:hypothetical protein
MTIRHPIQLSSEQAKLLRDCLAYTLKNRPDVDRSEKLSAIPLLICLSARVEEEDETESNDPLLESMKTTVRSFHA